MSDNFKNMCLELVDEPEKLAEFVKLYCSGNYKKECKKCKYCKFYEVDTDISSKYCSEKCKLKYTIKNSDWTKVKHKINKSECKNFPFDFREIVEMRNYSIIRHIFMDKENKYRQDLIQSICGIKATHKTNNYFDWVYDCLQIEDCPNMPKELINDFIKKFSIEKIKDNRLNIYKIIETLDKQLDNLIIQYLDETYLIKIFASNNVNLAQMLIDKLGKESLKNKYNNLWMEITKCDIYNLLYSKDEITDEMVIYFITQPQPQFPEYLNDYIFKNPNILFSSLTRKNINDLSSGIYTSRGGSCPFINFITTNAKSIKCEITKETLENFFLNAHFKCTYFSLWLGLLIKNVKAENIMINYFNYAEHITMWWDFESYLKLYNLGVILAPSIIYNIILNYDSSSPDRKLETNILKILTHYKKDNSIANCVETFRYMQTYRTVVKYILLNDLV